MHVKNYREIPEYEIDPEELDFTFGAEIKKVIDYSLVSFSESFILVLLSLKYSVLCDAKLNSQLCYVINLTYNYFIYL